MSSSYQLQLLLRHNRATINSIAKSIGITRARVLRALRQFEQEPEELQNKIAASIGCSAEVIIKIKTGKMTFLDYLRL